MNRARAELAWVAIMWVRTVRPRVVVLENVEEFRDWGPLITAEDGRVVPCPARKGLTFRRFVREFQRHGYKVEYRELRASDYGAPTIRKRLFLIARRDGQPIVWPKPTHAQPAEAARRGLEPWRTAAECIDWSIPCPSIFGRQRPLAEKTMARIARGIRRYVIEAAQPFIVPVTHAGGGNHALVAPFLKPRYGEREGQTPRALPIDGAMPTVVPTGNGGDLVAAFLAQHNGDRIGREAEAPLSTIVHRGTQQQVVAAFLAQHNTGMVGHDARGPVSTIVQKGCTQALVAATLHHTYTSNTAGGEGDPRKPMKTVTAGGQHHALVQAFLLKYYETAIGQRADEPAHTLTARARLGLVTVEGVDYQIVDIGMRMLTPRELFRAQGFPDSYIIDRGPPTPEHPAGRPLTKTAQIRMCGNSVCPPVAAAIIRANLGTAANEEETEAA